MPRPVPLHLPSLHDETWPQLLRRVLADLHLRGASVEEAEDVLQTVLLSLVADPLQIDRSRGTVAAWVITVARRRWVDRQRHLAVQRRAGGTLRLLVGGAHASPDHPLATEDARRSRRALLMALETDERDLFRGWMTQRAGRAGADVAHDLGLSPPPTKPPRSAFGVGFFASWTSSASRPPTCSTRRLPMADDWLDAFDPDELDDPALQRVDLVLDRQLQPTPRRRWPRVVLGAAAMLAAVAIGWPRPQPPADPVVPAPTAIDQTLPRPTPVTESPPSPLPTVAPPVPPPPPEPDPSVPTSAPPPVHPSPALDWTADSRIDIREGNAWLSEDQLVFRRDDTHRPAANQVVLPDLRATLQPVGTVFLVVERGTSAVLVVTQGAVDVVREDGGRVQVPAGREALLRAAPEGVDVQGIDGISLDAIVTGSGRHGSDAEALVALVAEARLRRRAFESTP